MENLTVREAMKLGIEAHNAGQTKRADQFFTAVLKAIPNHPDANHNLGVLAASIGQQKKALSFFERAVKSNSNIPQYWNSFLITLMNLGQFDEAAKLIEKAKTENLKKEQVDNLEAILTSGVKKQTQAPSRQVINRLLNLYQKGKISAVVAEAQTIVNQYPNSHVAWNIMGTAAAQSGQLNKAISAFKKVISLKPDFPEAYNNLGTSLQNQRKLTEAVSAYKKAISIKPDYAEAHNNLGAVLKEQGLLVEAIDAFKVSISIAPDYAEAYNNLGAAQKTQGKLEQSIVSYKKALLIKPNYLDALNNLGVSQTELKKLDEALDTFNKLISLKPAYAEVHNNKGMALKEQGKLEEAIESYGTALSLNSNNAQAHYNMANALHDKRNFEGAIDAYNKALSINSNYVEAINNLSVTLRLQGKLSGSEAACRKAIKINPDYAEAYDNLGTTLLEKGEKKDAIKAYSKALVINPDYTTSAENLLRLPIGQLNQEIIGLCEKIIKRPKNSVQITSKSLFAFAHLLKHKGHLAQSFEKLCEANKVKLKEVSHHIPSIVNANSKSFSRISSWSPGALELSDKHITKLFLLGPSASGKSTLEHMLSNSSNVCPMYENIQLYRLKEALDNGHNVGKSVFERLFFHKEETLADQGYQLITSTSPGSIFHADYLIDNLPNAYFIFINRDQKDVASEIFSSYYTIGNFISYDPTEICKYLDTNKNISKILESKIPERYTSIEFDDIIKKPMKVMEKISQFSKRGFDVENIKENQNTFETASIYRDYFAEVSKSPSMRF